MTGGGGCGQRWSNNNEEAVVTRRYSTGRSTRIGTTAIMAMRAHGSAEETHVATPRGMALQSYGGTHTHAHIHMPAAAVPERAIDTALRNTDVGVGRSHAQSSDEEASCAMPASAV